LSAALILLGLLHFPATWANGVADVGDVAVVGHAAPTLSTHTEEDYYPVTRWNPKQLLLPARPDQPLGHPATGLTSAELTLHKSLLTTPQGCRALELAIIIRIKITMPRWAGPLSAAPKTMPPLLAHLRAHEHGHRDQAIEAGARLQDSLSTLPLELNCMRLQRHIDQHLQRELFRLRMRADLYDQRTDFGRKGLPDFSRGRPKADLPRW
jgi:predicted secreted Zn-dependent protease